MQEGSLKKNSLKETMMNGHFCDHNISVITICREKLASHSRTDITRPSKVLKFSLGDRKTSMIRTIHTSSALPVVTAFAHYNIEQSIELFPPST